MASFPLLEFGKLNGFPEGFDDGKIRTTEFLDASSEVIGMLEAFGKLFKPVVSDMRGNVDKLQNHYQKDEKERCFLEDMVLKDQACDNNISRSSLLWLKRALEFIERFFWHIINDETHSKALNSHIKSAYKETLQTYHGYLLQKTFGVSVLMGNLMKLHPTNDSIYSFLYVGFLQEIHF